MIKPTERSFYLGVILILSVLIFFLRSCQPKCSRQHCDELKDFTPIKVTAIDSIEKIVKDSSDWHKPKEVKSSKEAQKAPILTKNDSFITSAGESVSNELKMAQECNLERFYSDTNNLDAGIVIVDSKVQNNELVIQRVKADLKTVEKTVTKTQFIPEKPRLQIYLGIIAQGAQTDPLKAFGTELMMKTKRDKIWKVAALYDTKGQMIYQVGTLFKLSLK